ncbi:MAG: secretin N-terminal domain-containing protein [Candidatus Omnitrophota bacterium]
MKNRNTVKLLGVSLLSLIALFVPIALAVDFDFYAPDLISKESYRKISMDFRDASLKTILKVFSEQAGLNFIASQVVQDRSITLFLDNVPLQEAMDKIMSANNLIYELEPGSNVFIVKEWGRPEVETITKVYNLKYTRLASSTLQKAISAGSAKGSAAGGGAAAAGGGSASSGGAQAGAGGEGGGETGIESSIKGVMTSYGKVMQDPRTNSLIVTDIPSQFELIDRVVALLDVPTPQVMIEVEMLDVSKRTVDQMGVKTTPGLMSLTGSSVPTKFPNFMWKGQDLSGLATPSFTYGTLSAAVFQAVLDYLTTDTKTKFLARPRILSLSNETAEIKITTNEAVGLKTTTQSAQGASTQTQEAERYETGISLNVTPQVDPATGTVTMFIKPTVSQARSGGTFGGTTFKDPEVRSSSTTLMVKDGETIVVGGLIRTNEETTISKMPIVGDIPIIGALFRHKNSTKEERELIVFITPRIIGFDNASTFAKNDITSSGLMPYREQSSAVSRKEAVDNMLERWDN